MRLRLSDVVFAALAIGALADVLMIRNGFSSNGPTLLDELPILWPVFLALIFLAAFACEFTRRRLEGAAGEAIGFLSTPLAILAGTFVTHTLLLVRDVIADPTSHNLWPLEYVVWGLVVAAPAYVGSILARVTLKARRQA